jgi:4-amino-4-deoxy-L-arabinose transferase-like glycosyltransferase
MKQKLSQYLPISIILCLATFLRFYQLSNQSLWSDEGNSVALARRGFVEIAQRTAFDIHPPLYYWLLKLWVVIFGDSEPGLRSLSAVLGIGLVYLIWLLGRRLFSRRVGLIAAFVAAVSPLQIYYSQETRMYMLLAFLSTLTVWLAVLMLDGSRSRHMPLLAVAYVLTVTAGLYTHYAYPVILIVVNLVALAWLAYYGLRVGGWRPPIPGLQSPIVSWLLLQSVPLLLYLPWLRTAIRQIITWPSQRQTDSLAGPVARITTTLLFGLSWPYAGLATIALSLVVAASLWFGLKRYGLRVAGRGWFALGLLWLWLLLPAILTVVIFSPAFLKFLLVAAPAFALLVAFVIWRLVAVFDRRWLGNLAGAVVLVALLAASALSLYHYFANSDFARDNYRGIAQFIAAVSGPDDAVILNAEGQQDVFNYYHGRAQKVDTSVHPLPRRRPLNETETLTELQNIADSSNKIYAVYWANRQADPKGLIEGWLDTHLFKATDQWYGNVRLVSYATPRSSGGRLETPVDYQVGTDIRLDGYTLAATDVAAGDILQVALQWQTRVPLTEDLTVFIQILDQNNHVVGQRDAKPRLATGDWPVGEPVADAHGIYLEPGTPPGSHRLILGLYDSQTGQRLPVTASGESGDGASGDTIDLGQIDVVSPSGPLPPEAFNIRVPLNVPLIDLYLWGYDLHKLGQKSNPDVGLNPGDPIQLVAYWSRIQPDPVPESWLTVRVVTTDGRVVSSAERRPLAGTDYPLSAWQAGEIVRAQYLLFLGQLEPGNYRLELTVENSARPPQQETAVTRPFRVENLAAP